MDVEQSRVGIVVATFGTDRWFQLASKRAVPTAEGQMFKDGEVWKQVRVTQRHVTGETLATVRNQGAREVAPFCDWLIFLDGDDELAPGYVRAMLDARPQPNELMVPAVQYVRSGRRQPPKFWPEQDYHDGNWLIIGTMVPTEAFLEVGGFRDYGMYEDWALFAAMQDLGYEPRKCPEAVYVAHRAARSRNNAGWSVRRYWHQKIGHDLWPDIYAELTPTEDEHMRLQTSHVRRHDA